MGLHAEADEVAGLGVEDDGDDNPVDGHCFTENDTDKILRFDSRHLNR